MAPRLFLVALLVAAGCDPCLDTEAEDIAVDFRITAHGIPPPTLEYTPKTEVHVEKRPCGEDPKGQFDLGGFVSAEGDYESQPFGYNLRNRADEIFISFDCDGIGAGTQTLGYDDVAPYAGGLCLIELVPEGAARLQDLYAQNPEAFVFCHHLAYAEITGQARAGVTKAEVAKALTDHGYARVSEGYIPETSTDRHVDLQEGDIVLFEFDGPAQADSAAHYAVVHGNRVWQVAYWGKDDLGQEVSVLDGPREIEWFFQPRVLVDPRSGEEKTFTRVYQYWAIYNTLY
ncbi:MAG: hypothetical protein JXR96_16620 [Deltaproteobacteria bacterium]|nr:hypothetical protein [Deltaproteobacteria bacterium]